AFAVGSFGYLVGTTLAARMVMRLGVPRTLGIGSVTLAAGGLLMLAALALELTSAFSLVLPMGLYLAGLGMVLPQAAAGALTPFPDRAGAASSLFGFLQQSGGAICGAIVSAVTGQSAWPMALGVAVTGGATLAVWLAT